MLDVDDHPKPRRDPEPRRDSEGSDVRPGCDVDRRRNRHESDADDVGVVHAHRTAPSPFDATDAFAAARASSRGAVAGTDRPSFFALVPPAKRHAAAFERRTRGQRIRDFCNSPSRKSRAASLGRDAETNAEGPACTTAERRNQRNRAARPGKVGDEIHATPLWSRRRLRA